jgi:low temperature requirement protein LtrA
VGDPLSPARLAAVAAAFTLACALWWVYFVFAASAVRHAVATARIQTDIIRQVLAYGHLAFIGAIIAVAVGLAEVVAHPLTPLALDVAALMVGGTALYLAVFGYTRWRMFGTVSWTRLGAAAVCVLLLPAVLGVPALAALLALVVVTVALNVLEAAIVARARRRAAQAEALPAPDLPTEE